MAASTGYAVTPCSYRPRARPYFATAARKRLVQERVSGTAIVANRRQCAAQNKRNGQSIVARIRVTGRLFGPIADLPAVPTAPH